MRTMLNKIFIAISWIMGVIWIVSVCALDSHSWIPTVACGIATLYFAAVVYLCGKCREGADE